jgi:hypothetical protein
MARWSRRRAGLGVALGLAPALVGCRGKSGGGERPPAAIDPELARVARRIRATAAIDGAGAHVLRVFPSPQLRHLDPFVLLDDFDVAEPAGFPDHPHRGFEAFTYMIAGAFHHRDSLGNDSEIGPGGTQRFNSGRGARHSEMPGPAASNRGLQLWVNLPRVKKTMAPEYEGILGEDMPVRERDGLRVREVVGPDSPVRLHTAVEYADVTLLADAAFEREVRSEDNALVYVLGGAIAIAGETVERGEAVVLAPGSLAVRGDPGARFAYLAGRPHHEPIRHRGPFVD